MKFSKDTMDVLKNFASINKSILLLQGNTLRTINETKTVVARAQIQEEIPQEVAIYDLNQFLGTASLFDDPDFKFGESAVTIKSKNAQAKYVYAAKDAIIFPPNKDPSVPDIRVEFTLDSVALQAALKAAAVMGLPHIILRGEDMGDVFLTAADNSNDSTHSWQAKVGECTQGFRMIYRLELFKFLPRDYKVSISSKMISRFEASDVTYFIAAETGSAFDGEK